MLYSWMIGFIFKINMYKVEMSLCKNYYGKVFGHLAAAFGIASVSAEYVNILPILNISGSKITGIILLFGLIILTIVGMFNTATGGILKYIMFIVFALLMGQSVKPLVKKLEDNNRLVHILSITMGVFLGMTLLGFYDNQNLLGFGPYLFMGLLGLLLVSLIMYFVKLYGEKTEMQILYYIDIFGVGLFSLYISYHIQKIKEHAQKCQSMMNRGIQPDYPIESLTLFLDVINIFTRLAEISR